MSDDNAQNAVTVADIAIVRDPKATAADRVAALARVLALICPGATIDECLTALSVVASGNGPKVAIDDYEPGVS